MTDLSVPQSLLHPLKASVIGFQEEEHDYHFQVEYHELGREVVAQDGRGRVIDLYQSLYQLPGNRGDFR